MNNYLFKGVNAASITAMNEDLSINYEKSIEHARWLLNNGCNGLALSGTTGEANSLSCEERELLLEKMVAAGVPAAKMLPGTSTCNLPETVRLTRHAESLGCKGVLLLPPFYYKNPSDDGLFAYFGEIINRAGGEIKIYLYHFPQQSSVPFGLPLIERLIKAFPGKVKGIKDSGGDFNNTKACIDNFSADGFEVYTGADADFLQVLQAGGAGCITATSNIACPITAKIYRDQDNHSAIEAQALLRKIRKVVALAPTVAAVKALQAHIAGDESWANIRPPFCKLTHSQNNKLISEFEKLAL